MDEWQVRVISEEAKEILGRMIGGSIFGFPIASDSDSDILIVAAYHMGKSEQLNRHADDLRALRDVLK